jgi:GPH family glycoside/pentoside/hexuronide:cation symporter
MTAATLQKTRLPRKQVFGYLMGIVPLTLFAGFYGLAYAKFFLHDLKLDPTYWYIGLVIYALVNMFNDPIIGNMSDNTDVKKWGSRRLIFIKYGGPIYAIAFALIWWIPTNHGSQFLLFLHFVLSICFYETFFTMVTMCWYALLPDMTMDVDERARINFLGSIIMLVLGFPMMFVSTLEHQEIKYLSLVIAIIGLVANMMVVKFSKERPEFHHDKAIPLKESIKLAWKSKGYKIFMGFNFTGMLSGSINAAFLFLFWFLIGEANIGYYLLIVVIVGYGSNLLCMKLRKKVGMVKLIVSFGIMRILSGVFTYFMAINDLNAFMWLGIALTAFFGGSGVFTYILQTSPIDEDELKNGSRREGMFFGINALFTMPANSIGPIIGTAIMLAFGYVQGGDALAQPPEVLEGIKFIFFLLPALFAILGLLVVRNYPLDNKELEKLELDLEVIHTQKKEALLAIEHTSS